MNTSRMPSTHDINRAAVYFVAAELALRATKVTVTTGRDAKIIAEHRDRKRSLTIDVVAKLGGVGWQTDTSGARPAESGPNETHFVVYVDLKGALASPRSCPTYYVMPEWWIANDIYEAHQRYLAEHGGIRPVTPTSTHHSVQVERVEQWHERWDVLGLS